MLRSTSTAVRYPDTSDEEELDGPAVPNRRDHQGEVECAAEPRREPERDARLLIRAPTRVAAERQARHRRRGHGEEAAADPDPAARAKRRPARHAGAPGARRRTRGSRPSGARAQVGDPAAAAGPRYAGDAARGP